MKKALMLVIVALCLGAINVGSYWLLNIEYAEHVGWVAIGTYVTVQTLCAMIMGMLVAREKL